MSFSLPADIPYVFISSVTGYGISALKDLLWRELNADDMQKVNFSLLARSDLSIESLMSCPSFWWRRRRYFWWVRWRLIWRERRWWGWYGLFRRRFLDSCMHPHPEYPTLLQFDLLSAEPGIEHFFTTRSGGVSKGEFSSLNLGNYSDDDPVAIFDNLTILARMWYMKPSDFIVPHQTHGSRILVIDEHFLSLPLSQKRNSVWRRCNRDAAEKLFFVRNRSWLCSHFAIWSS